MRLAQRVLFVAWQDATSRRILPVGRLVDRGPERDARWEFTYVRGAEEAGRFGFQGFAGMAELTELYLSRELPPFFTNRLMPERRPDFASHLHRLGLPQDARDEIPILVRSEGRRATDTIELFGFPSLDAETNRLRFHFFARGVRHLAGAEQVVASLAEGEKLEIVECADNEHDHLAIELQHDSRRVGFVPNTLVEDVRRLRDLNSRVQLFAQQKNLSPAPVQLRLLCRLEATWVPGYTPFASERFQPIAPEATRLHVTHAALAG